FLAEPAKVERHQPPPQVRRQAVQESFARDAVRSHARHQSFAGKGVDIAGTLARGDAINDIEAVLNEPTSRDNATCQLLTKCRKARRRLANRRTPIAMLRKTRTR